MPAPRPLSLGAPITLAEAQRDESGTGGGLRNGAMLWLQWDDPDKPDHDVWFVTTIAPEVCPAGIELAPPGHRAAPHTRFATPRRACHGMPPARTCKIPHYQALSCVRCAV